MDSNFVENLPDISFIDYATIEQVQEQMIQDYQEKYEELTGKKKTLALADRDRLILYAATVQLYQTMQYVDLPENGAAEICKR